MDVDPPKTTGPFHHDKLLAYQLARRFAAEAYALVKSLPRGHQYLANQFMRAAGSVPLNVAEGGGEFSPAEKARFYRIARRSGTECAAILDLIEDRGLIDRNAIDSVRATLVEVVKVVTALVVTHSVAK